MGESLLPVWDLSDAEGRAGLERVLVDLAGARAVDVEHRRIAVELIESTRRFGDSAIVEHMRMWTDPTFDAGRIAVTPAELADAERRLDPSLRGPIERAIGHVRAYQEHILPADAEPLELDGASLGLRWTPIRPAGLLVPGGSAVLFSSLIMLAVPAMAAGVAPEDIAVVSPPPTRRLGQAGDAPRDISPITLAVASMLGLSKVYRVGGPPAVAALAHGTESIAKVNLIAGPGHPVVQAAKLAVAPAVAVDGYYGTSEVVVIADGSADPACVAADLLAQAEHDPGRCFLVTWDRELLGRVVDQMQQQLPGLPRRPAIERALAEASAALLVRDLDEAIEVADRLASEHVSLAVDDPSAVAACLSHGGELFLGRDAPVAAGDYYAGPSHTLPTGTTARFSSGVSVYTFLKRTGTVAYPGGLPPQAADDIAAMAQAEGLEAHAASVRVR